jgi:hypothetical protein
MEIQENGLEFQGLVASWAVAEKGLSVKMFQEILVGLEEWYAGQLQREYPGRYEGAGYGQQAKVWDTPFGRVQHRYRFLVDKVKRKRFSILRRFLEIPERDRYPLSTVAGALNLCPELSFRKASKAHREEIGAGPGKSRTHSLFQEIPAGLGLDCRREEGSRMPYAMVPDGTGIKIQAGGGCKHGENQKDRPSEIRLVLGLDKWNRVSVLERTVDLSWEDIGKKLKERYPGEAVVMVSDGEDGMKVLLGGDTVHQRCLTHGWRGLSQALYQDGLKKPKQGFFKGLYFRAQAFQQDKEALQTLPKESKTHLNALLQEAETWSKAIYHLLPDKAVHAKAYIQGFRDNALSYLRQLLNNEKVVAINNNAVENAFSQTDTRLKSIGKGRWGVPGCVAMVNALLAKAYNKTEWERFIAQLKGRLNQIQIVKLEISHQWKTKVAYT